MTLELALCLSALAFFMGAVFARRNEGACTALATVGCSLLVALAFVLVLS